MEKRRQEDKELYKQATKEAIKEFLNEKAAQFGRWSFTTLGLLVFTAVIYLMLWAFGWHPPHDTRITNLH